MTYGNSISFQPLTLVIAIASAACGGSGARPVPDALPPTSVDASAGMCGIADVDGDPCRGLIDEVPERPAQGSLTLGTETHVLNRGGLAEVGSDYVGTFPFGDQQVLGLTLDFETEKLVPPVYLGNLRTGDWSVLSAPSISVDEDRFRITASAGNLAVSAIIPVSLILAGDTTLSVDGTAATLKGELAAVAYFQILDLIADHPEVKTLILQDVPGSINDEVNMQTGRLIRNAGFETIVPDGGRIASGGVDLFASGLTRKIEGNTEVGVHSWSDGNIEAKDLACDDDGHRAQLCYFSEMLSSENGTAFYFFTIAAADADDVHLMTPEEIATYQLTTE